MYLSPPIQPMCTLYLRDKSAVSRLDINTWVGLIPKETSFIDSVVRQTPYTETISTQLKCQYNTIK
jgi:hypothetical protein